MNKVLCSTGALIGRYNKWDYRLIETYSCILGCDAFEFMMYSRWENDVERLKETLKNMPVEFPVVHEIKQIG